MLAQTMSKTSPTDQDLGSNPMKTPESARPTKDAAMP